MKVSVSLPDEDVEFLDQYAETQGYESRSAVVHKAVRLLRSSELGRDYADAWKEWSELGDADAWDVAVSDGLAPR
jgi:Arc/MetJ-type ribon-helix-helix transcriptional regulator